MSARRHARVLATAAACACGAGAAACGADAPTPCDATFAGNFTDHTSSAANCPTVAAAVGAAGQALTFALASARLDAPLAVSIDLGSTPAPGTFSSEDVDTWSALATRSVGSGACFYSAGDDAVPTGSFELVLAAIDAAAHTAHGTLAVEQYVQAQALTDCGSGDNETVDVEF